MVTLQAARLVIGLSVPVGAVFLPQPFRLFEGGNVEGIHPPNIRHFRHRLDHRFEDGSDLSLHWDVDTDPDSLLELDLEHRRGVRIIECSQGHLVLQVPKETLHRMEKLEHVTASHMLHPCKHLAEKNLYHRIQKIRKIAVLEADSALVDLHTKELATAQEVFRSCRFHIHIMPAGAKDPQVLQRELRERSKHRRLSESFMDLVRDGLNSVGDVHGTNFKMKTGFTPDKANDAQDKTFFNLNNPTEQDRFHWNYTYEANSTENPQYKYTFPGGTAWLRLFKPKVHAWLGFTMNLSSHMPDITQAPHETVDILVQSFADLDLDIGTAADFDEDRSSSVLHNMLDVFPIPILSKLKTDTAQFMRPFTFHIGGTPITVTPGWSINMKIFHIGQLKGTMRVGLETKLLSRGTMHFDTTFGEQHNFSVEMKNVNFTSPAWLLFTKHFQLGVEFEPNIWVKGGFGFLQDVELGFGFRPYCNISITEQSDDPLGGSETNELAIYPYRVVGLPFGSCFALKISANGQYKTTACQVSVGGVIRFQNKVEIFEFPPTTQNRLLTDPIKVDVLKDGKETVATGEIVCQKLANGKCEPHPTQVRMVVGNQEVVVDLGIYFQANALSELEINMQSISVRVPMFTLDHSATALQKVVAQEENRKTLELCLCHNGREMCSKLKAKFPGENQLFTSDTIWELGPVFTENWLSKPVAALAKGQSANEQRVQNKVAVRANGTIVAIGTILQTNIKEEKPLKSIEDLESERKEAMQTLPTQVMLMDAANPNKMVGSCQIELDIMPVEYGAFWVQPFEGDRFVVGLSYTFAWATHGAVAGSYYSFTIALHEVTGEQCAGVGKQFTSKDIEVKCTKDPRVKVHRYYGGHLPCVFENEVVCPPEAAGKTVIALASWHDAMNLPHFMESNAFFCDHPTGRRLSNQTALQAATQLVKNDESVGFGFESQGHHEGLTRKARRAFRSLAKHCHEKPLKYSIGAGINYIQLVKNIPYAGGAMGTGDGKSNPMSGHFTPDGSYVSNPYQLWRLGDDAEHRKRLSDLLPESVCAGGICEGMMLGCQKTKIRPINIPKIIYKLTRTFNWIPHVGPSARHVIAYGLMVLPAAVKEAGREAQQMEKALEANGTNQSQPLQTMAEDFQKIFQPEQSRRLQQKPFQTPAGGEFREETLDDMEDDWSKHGAFDEMVVQITEPMHYPITDEVMEYLLAADAFRGLEDGREATHGPIKVIGYELLHSPAAVEKTAKKHSKVKETSPSQRATRTTQRLSEADSQLWDAARSHTPSQGAVPLRTGLGLCAVAAALASSLCVALLARGRRGYSALSSQSEAGEAASA
mmetsp:Transcript_48785/g.114571  ORF Transcript_48785/g.114571 Transcript_48785/m.114571 type:complete len:1327 (-) Transcript_48785:150-4130(-)